MAREIDETPDRKEVDFINGKPVQTKIVCQDCGWERPSTQEYPAMTNCGDCGGVNLEYER